MTTQTQSAASPRDTFLTVADLRVRYPWGRTKTYDMTKSEGFPRPIGGAYRLDTLLTWEDRVLAGEIPGTPTSKVRGAAAASPSAGSEAETLTAEQAQAILDAPDYVDPTKRRRAPRRAA